MRKVKKYSLLISLLLLALFFVSCPSSDKDIQESPHLPDEGLEGSITNTIQINTDVDPIIEKAIQNALTFDTLVNPAGLAQEIVESVDNVVSAEPTKSGAGIIIKQSDGTFSNLLLTSDERLFEEKTAALMKTTVSVPLITEILQLYFPEIHKAVILAPFQDRFFAVDLEELTNFLQNAGFEVDTFVNENAGIDKFKGDFLSQYGVIIFCTHGMADAESYDGSFKSTALATGSSYTIEEVKKLKEDGILDWDNLQTIASISVKNDILGTKSYLGVTVQWFRKTTTKNNSLPNAWIFASACESSLGEGDASLSNWFLYNTGTGGYSGYNGIINSHFCKIVTPELVKNVCNGQSLMEATASVKSNPDMYDKMWFVRLIIGEGYESQIDVNLLDSKKPNDDEEFYIIEPSIELIELKNDDGTVENSLSLGQCYACCGDNLNAMLVYLTPPSYPFNIQKIKVNFRFKSPVGFYLHIRDENGNELLPMPFFIDESEVNGLLDPSQWWIKDISSYGVTINSGRVQVSIYDHDCSSDGWTIWGDTSSQGNSQFITWITISGYPFQITRNISIMELMIRAEGY